jgi:hypothetical protein
MSKKTYTAEQSIVHLREAVHPLSRLEKSATLSHAFVCMHEFEEVGAMEMEGTDFRAFFASLKKSCLSIRQF